MADVIDDIVVVSTTDTRAELEHAGSKDWRNKFDPSKVAVEKPKESSEAPAPKEDAKTGAEPETAQPKSEEGKSKTETAEEDKDWEGVPAGVRKRIEKLTARAKSAEETIERMRSEKKEPVTPKVESTETEGAKPWDDASDPEPDFEGSNPATKQPWKNIQEFNRGHFSWLNRQQARQDAYSDWQGQVAELDRGFSEQIQTLRSKHGNFEEVAQAATKFNMDSEAALAIKELPNGAEVLFSIASKPEEMEAFVKLSPRRQIAELGRISASLLPSQSVAPVAPKPKLVSNAPAPTTPEKGSSSKAATRLDDENIDTDEYIRRKNEEERASRRRN